MSAPAAQPPAGGQATPPPADPESCPLCGTTLDPDQDWCLRCGAAARPRLASAPTWKAPIVLLAVIAALALAVLAVALVKLAGKSNSSATTSTLTVPAAAAAPATSPAAPATGGATTTTTTAAPATISTATPPVGSKAPTGVTHGGIGSTSAERPVGLTPAAEKKLREEVEALRKSRSKRSPSG